MKFASKMALGIALAVSGSVVSMSPALAKKKDEAPAAAAPNLSKPVHMALSDAQKALDANDLPTANAKIAEAQAALVTPDDKYFTGTLRFRAASKANDEAGQLAATEQMLDSGAAPADMMVNLVQNQGALAYRAKDYAKTERAYARLAQLKPNDPDTLVSLAEIQYDNKKPAESLATSKLAVAAKKASGTPVPENWYKRPLSIAYESKLVPQEIEWSQALVEAYPSADSWRTALTLYRDASNLDDQRELDVYRLQFAAKALKGERDYFDYALSTSDRGLPGETKAILDDGIANKMIDSSNGSINQLRTSASAKAAPDKASLAGLDTRARAAADGKSAANTANAYLGYKEYAKAADLYRVALQKGGVDADTINTRLGMALALSGQKAAALQALGAVAAAGPRGAIAHYWMIWVSQQG